MNPTVSVIVPCYNSSGTVERTLDSLRAQTLRDMEIVVINDGSKDNTLEVLEKYAETYPDFNMHIYSKENEGIAEARNFGLRHVTGEYIGFLDSDDYTTEDMYRTMYSKAKEDDYELVVSNFYWVNSKGKREEKEGPYACGPEMMVNLFAVLWNKIYRHDLIRSLDFEFPYGNRYEDAYYLYLMTSHLSHIAFVDQAFVHYIQSENSITHNNNEEVKNMINVFEGINKYYKEHLLMEKYHDALEYIHIRFFLGNSFLRSSRIKNKQDRTYTIRLGWDLLNREYPEWHKNPYLKQGGAKNLYFRMVYGWNIYFFAWIFRHFKKENL
ncbi:MAG: glycosyltransferase family 2 protein [Solobacterium sp.]|nr:glycosyltransferase family 2 protein [Solobacterium sp.]